MLASELELEQKLADEVAKYYDDPLGFVMFAYDWDNDPELHVCRLVEPWASRYKSEWGPDAWSCQFLDDLGAKIKERGFDGQIAVQPIRMGVASGHGIGKSALIAWLADFIPSTRPHSRGTVTANTAPQLESKTWAEIAKWTKRCITGHWFHVTTGRGSMKKVHKEYPDSWTLYAQTCVKENSEAFAGQHAPTSTSYYLFDESSAIEDVIDEVSEGGCTDGEPWKIAFGNPTRNVGWFKDSSKSKRWDFRHIDSRTVQITNKATIAEMIADYGEDSDRVKIRVRGMFPSQSVRQFFSTADLDAAQKRHYQPAQYQFAPLILVLDNAWEGDDDVVISMRQGLMFKVLFTCPKNDNDVDIATKLATLEDELHADAVFIDAGYGTGVFSIGSTMGRSWQLVWFGAESPDPGYLNKRAWMAGQAKAWLKQGGAIDPADMKLYNEMQSIEQISSARLDGKIQLESKKDLKARGEPSPGRLDTLMMTFAFPVLARKLQGAQGAPSSDQREYDPYAQMSR